jgi:D-serine deaminase-like pyridoxal phosphate-dependent protein
VGERQAAVAKAVQQVQLARELVRAVGLDLPVITGAGTGTFGWEARSQVYTELQAGSYLFMDADYARNERDAHQPVFEHALFVKSQVMSVQAQHVVVDAGHKSHAIDSGLPTVWQHALRATACNDEHTTLVIDEAIAQDKSTPALAALPGLGDTVWLVPGHCDPTVNLHDVMVGVRGGLDHGTVTELIRVDARGCLQ